jgi:homoserine kinase
MVKRIRVKATATVSNLNCGFDVLGMAINEPGDFIDLEMNDTGEVVITGIKGCSSLSTDPDKNVVGVVLKAMISKVATIAGLDPGLNAGLNPGLNEGPKTATKPGFKAYIEKGITPGSGIGSSAASSAAAAFAANELLGKIFSLEELVAFAMEGERLASGTAHADNVAPALMGGITLIRSYEPLDIIRVNIPPELFCVVIHPDMEIKTSMARGILDKHIPLRTAVKQWGNVGGLIAGFFSEDYDLIGRSLVDHVAEPKRSSLIPGFQEMKEAAMQNGALGAGISGSGPSVFALCRGEVSGEAVLRAMKACLDARGITYIAYLSPVNRAGAETC